jgi:HEAT repeat protein
MNIPDIEALLASEDPQMRLKGLVALKDHDSEAAVPVLLKHRRDSAFLVRSFVAMGLGRKRNDVAYQALLEMIATESDNNVQAEIANSLGLYGPVAADRLVALYHENDHWLVRRSILAIMPELDRPELLLEIALAALQDADQTLVQAGVVTLGMLADTSQSAPAIAAITPLLNDERWRLRVALAHALKPFAQMASEEGQVARDALIQLRQDSHYRVVAAALESLLPE